MHCNVLLSSIWYGHGALVDRNITCCLTYGDIRGLEVLYFSMMLFKQNSSFAGIAVSCGGLVGLDVEETLRHTRSDPLKLARRRLAPAELASLESKLCMQSSVILLQISS